MPKQKLLRSMSLKDFDNGYWYAVDLKAFAKKIGILRSSRLRKDELEFLIRKFLKTGEISTSQRNLSTPKRIPDSTNGLTPSQPILCYKNDSETKEFLESQARRFDPNYRIKSGAKYRLNRWREAQLAQGKDVTYGELAKEYVRLSKISGPFPKAPSGRYINFLSDYHQAYPQATRDAAIDAWKELKKLDIPKTFAAWQKWFESSS